MRIAYIVPSLRNKAPVQVVRNLARVMTAHGHVCCVYYFDDRQELDFPCETRRINLSTRIDFGRYDVIHSHCLRSNLYVMLHHLHIPKHTKRVMTIHSYVCEDFAYEQGRVKGWLMTRLLLATCRFHDHIVTLSKDAVEYYSRWIPREKLTDIYNCVMIDSDERLTEEEETDILTFKKDGILLGVNCWLKKVKGLDVLISSLQKLPSQYRLYIVGDGPEETALIQLVKQLRLEERVKFAGAKLRAYRFLPHIDVFALTSWSEGFSLSLLEAALHGRPCVSSNLADIKEKYGDLLFYFPMPDEEALAQAIVKAAGEEGRQKAAQLKILAENKFSPEEFYNRHMEVYSMHNYSSTTD